MDDHHVMRTDSRGLLWNNSLIQSRGQSQSINTQKGIYKAGIHLLKVNNKNTGTRCEICSKLTIKVL